MEWFAAPITYSFVVDTSAFQGVTGSIEFQFNPGGGAALPASAELTDFSGGSLQFGPNSPFLLGHAAGDLAPGPALFDNGTPLNALIHDFDFHAEFRFTLTVSGVALVVPDPLRPGTRFSLFLWDDREGFGNVLLLIDDFTDPTLLVDLLPDGQVVWEAVPEVRLATNASVPEPASWIAFLVVAGAVGVARRRRATR